MKKMMMMAAVMGLMGNAGAAGNVSGNITFSALVSNVCQVNGANFPGGTDNLTAIPNPFAYNAADTGTQGATASFSGYTIQCTAGTEMTVTATPNGGASNPGVAGINTLTGPMSLFKGSTVLAGEYTVNMSKAPSTGSTVGDFYTGNASFKADNGQWGVPAGEYTNTLLVTLSYN